MSHYKYMVLHVTPSFNYIDVKFVGIDIETWRVRKRSKTGHFASVSKPHSNVPQNFLLSRASPL